MNNKQHQIEMSSDLLNL